MGSVQLNTVSAVEAVCSALEKDILNLRFAPGEQVVESELSARYGVSRNTVRESVAHLLAQGLLSKIANKGIYVRRYTTADIREIFHLRALLELEAVKCIIGANSDLAHLSSIVDTLERLDRQTQWDDYVCEDIRFHSELVAAAGSPRLLRLYGTIITEVKLCIYQTRHYVPVPATNHSQHRMILDAIMNGEADRATELLQKHIEDVIKRYCAGLIAMDQTQ